MRGIHLLPNAFTAANLACGFVSIALTSLGNATASVVAAWLIIVAWVMDACDGRVARWTRSVSEFGVEFDSLADLVAFGVAPALMVLKRTCADFGAIAFAAAFAYCLAGALRLARFNVQARAPGQSSYFFTGCPIPAAAVLLASLIINDMRLAWGFSPQSYLIVTVGLAILMVSSLPYPSMKKPRERQTAIWVNAVILAILCLALATYREGLILLATVIYALAGPAWRMGRLAARSAGWVKQSIASRGGHGA